MAEISLNGDVADVDKEMGEDLSSYYDNIFASATTAKVMVMKHHLIYLMDVKNQNYLNFQISLALPGK